jgi:hypothetical protein
MKTKILAVIIRCAFVIGFTGSFCSVKTIKLKISSGAKIRCIYQGTSGGGKRPAVLILPGLSGLRTSWKQDYNSFAKWLEKNTISMFW